MTHAAFSRSDIPPAHRTRWIVNPVAGAGRGRRLDLSGALSRLGGDARLDETLRPGHARHLARRAALEGADLVVAAGGDGTIHEVVNGLFDAAIGGRAGSRLGVVDCGTGSGFAESLGLPPTHEAQLALLERVRARAVDLGRLACASADDRPVCRVFVNECQVGVGAAVCANLGRQGKRLGGRLGFALAALVTGLGHRGTRMEVTLDDGPPVTRRLLGLVVANGSRCGGGMRLAPTARLDDGLLDVVLIHDVPIGRRVEFLRRVYRGTHVDGVRCSAWTARRLRVRTSGRVPVAADGEVLGVTPLEIEILPDAIGVLRPCGGGGE